jgi:hypothetical protein
MTIQELMEALRQATDTDPGLLDQELEAALITEGGRAMAVELTAEMYAGDENEMSISLGRVEITSAT